MLHYSKVLKIRGQQVHAMMLRTALALYSKCILQLSFCSMQITMSTVFSISQQYSGIPVARFPFIEWAELFEAGRSMSKPNSPQEKSLKKHDRRLLRITVRLKMPSKCYLSAQMTRRFKQALSSKQCQKNVDLTL